MRDGENSICLYSSEHEHVILLGDFNVETKETCMQSFLKLYGFEI